MDLLQNTYLFLWVLVFCYRLLSSHFQVIIIVLHPCIKPITRPWNLRGTPRIFSHALKFWGHTLDISKRHKKSAYILSLVVLFCCFLEEGTRAPMPFWLRAWSAYYFTNNFWTDEGKITEEKVVSQVPSTTRDILELNPTPAMLCS